ncbi:MAG: DNA ligase [Thiomicrorhabdus sp.]|nr:DNA ligase [Thiomicrorhabdus sp.]
MIKFRLILCWLLLPILLVLSGFSSASSIETSHKPQKPSLILLKVYRSDMDVTGWLLSEKLDGVRAYWDGQRLLSRNGNMFFAPTWFTQDLPPFELDGELWMGRDQFQEVMSVVTRHQPDARWRNVRYQVFEVPNQAGGLLNRLAVLQRYLENTSVSHLNVISQTVVTDAKMVEVQLQKVLALKGEGLVLRQADRLYHTGRSSDAMKVKQTQDAECRVVGYTLGKGKYQGQTGALKCQLLVGDFLKLKGERNRVIKIGSGLTDKIRKSPPAIGSVITFQYMGLTKKGLPRFPVFVRVRINLGSE